MDRTIRPFSMFLHLTITFLNLSIALEKMYKQMVVAQIVIILEDMNGSDLLAAVIVQLYDWNVRIDEMILKRMGILAIVDSPSPHDGRSKDWAPPTWMVFGFIRRT